MDNQPDWIQFLKVDTRASKKDLASDIWDNENCVSYSADGERLLDAENFPGEVTVKDGTRIICDKVFQFEPYMAEDRKIGEEIPEDERTSFLEKIKLPQSVTHIGRRAFCECGWMTSIKLPKELLVIGDEAFSMCFSLKSVTCPAGLISIGDDAFEDCFSLHTVKLNKGLKALGAGAFFNCQSLEEIILPASLEFIGDEAFAGSSLQRILVPKSARADIMELLPSGLRRKVRNLD